MQPRPVSNNRSQYSHQLYQMAISNTPHLHAAYQTPVPTHNPHKLSTPFPNQTPLGPMMVNTSRPYPASSFDAMAPNPNIKIPMQMPAYPQLVNDQFEIDTVSALKQHFISNTTKRHKFMEVFIDDKYVMRHQCFEGAAKKVLCILSHTIHNTHSNRIPYNVCKYDIVRSI